MDPEATPQELSDRQEEILALIVESYTHKTEPVSSKFLKETYTLSYSSATIRNEMAVLDDLGYIKAPHTSAGRIPTELGYRYFVKRLLDSNALLPGEQAYIAERFQNMPTAMEQWLRGAAQQLARTVQIASLVTPPVAETSRFKHVELISIQGRLCLMVLVLKGGSVHQQMLHLADAVSQQTLSETADRINQVCTNLNANEIRRKGIQLNALERDVCELAGDLMERADNNQGRYVYRDGLSEVVGTFEGREGAQQALRVFEENTMLDMILNEFVMPLDANDVQVVIAGEGRWEELSHLTMILSRYGIPGQASGALGLIGPTHIDYPRAVGTVRYVAQIMTQMLQDLYRDMPADPPTTPPDQDD
jgi:heat-inducible transcriptional repressor